jgi:hypothetical protein
MLGDKIYVQFSDANFSDDFESESDFKRYYRKQIHNTAIYAI